ncbi:hypothetical protein G6F64_014818 [Rhizopus arrhizus]|uniref:Uncharacterized protein n=1 Tax=Rhizopus oryzae TaxID=64495 RepID=A0A9P6WTH8_RHIOR|nr:hypothetical protein G6F64_014818 [Rhizopus arrhizus]
MGRHPPAAAAAARRNSPVVTRRGAAGWSLPGDRTGRVGTARWVRTGRRAAGLGREWRAAARLHCAADPHPASQARRCHAAQHAGARARL